MRFTEYATCLYCAESTGSIEHVLASGIGGRLKSGELVCGYHNSLCNTFADDPLSRQFQYAVHSLEVLKGNGERGTVLMNMNATNNAAMFEVSSDFVYTIKKAKVEKDVDGYAFRVTSTKRDSRLHESLSRSANMMTSETRTVKYSFNPEHCTHGPGMRGILKAAFHLVAIYAERETDIRNITSCVKPLIFTDKLPSCVRVCPYDAGDSRKDAYFHELVAWCDPIAECTFVRVNVFNIVTYLVTLPFVNINPVRYSQNTKDGKWSAGSTDVPMHTVYESDDMEADFRREYACRVDVVSSLGRCKAEIVDLITQAKKRCQQWDALDVTTKRSYLYGALSEGFQVTGLLMRGWSCKDLKRFADDKVEQAANS